MYCKNPDGSKMRRNNCQLLLVVDSWFCVWFCDVWTNVARPYVLALFVDIMHNRYYGTARQEIW